METWKLKNSVTKPVMSKNGWSSMLRTICAALFLCASSAAAQDIVVNGTFDTSTAGWSVARDANGQLPPSSAIVWTAEDADGAADSGSLRLTVLRGSLVSLYQCVAASEGIYVVGGKVRTPTQPEGSLGKVSVSVAWYSGTCFSGLVAGIGFPLNEPGTAWQYNGLATIPPVTHPAPPGTQSAWIEFHIGTVVSFSDPEFSAYVDDIQVTRIEDGPPEITSFVATPSAANPGDAVTLSWTTAHATDASLMGRQPINGRLVVRPDTTTTYTLSAGNHGVTSAQVTVSISHPRRRAVRR